MIHSLIEFSLKNRFLVIAFYLGIGGWGWWALSQSPVDAIPDLSDNQVIVFTDWTGRSPQEVEDQVTYPLTVSLQGLPGVRVVRSGSAFGFSMIFIIFEDDVDLYFARTRVLERLNLVGKQMPPGVTPTLGPDATGVGHVFWYTVEGKGQNLRDLRTLQDWFIRYQLNAVAGVAEVASVGGEVQQYQVDLDPNRLRTYGLPLSKVVDAVMRSNVNVGGNVLESNGSWSIVRGLGLITSVGDIESIVIGAKAGVPVYVRDVATVGIGNAFRVASLVKSGNEAVGGVIVARSGANPSEVIERVKAKITDLSSVWIEGNVLEDYFATVRTGSRATITTPAYPERIYRGAVDYIDPRVDPQTRTAKVRVVVENADLALRLGMYMDMLFIRAGARVPVVPAQALQRIGSTSVVYTPVEGQPGQFRQHTVTARPDAAAGHRVAEGLRPGERVVTDGSFLLRAEALRQYQQ